MLQLCRVTAQVSMIFDIYMYINLSIKYCEINKRGPQDVSYNITHHASISLKRLALRNEAWIIQDFLLLLRQSCG